MTTTQKRTIKATQHVRKAERYLGGPLEETLKPYLNQRGTMSDLAHAIGVQKATVNYWIMKLGIKYARVAYDEGEAVRVLSDEEAKVADAAIESGLDADDLEQLDSTTFAEYAKFKASDSGDVQFANLTPQDLKLLETIKQLNVMQGDFDDEQDIPALLEVAVELSERGISPRQLGTLTRDDVRMLSHLKEIGATLPDVKTLENDSFRLLLDMWEKGLRYEHLTGITRNKLWAFNRVEAAGLTIDQVASVSKEDLETLEKVRAEGWDNDKKLTEDLETLEKVRAEGWDNDQKLMEDQELLRSVRELGLDNPIALEAYRAIRSAAVAA